MYLNSPFSLNLKQSDWNLSGSTFKLPQGSPKDPQSLLSHQKKKCKTHLLVLAPYPIAGFGTWDLLKTNLFTLIQVKEEGWTGFSKGWQGCSEGNLEEKPCQPKQNPVHPNSFTWIYILFKTGHFGDIFKY